jgi:predicted nucleic acid-binding protein
VVYDACVLYPAPLRDLLMHLALTDLFHAKWSVTIHEEWIRNVLRNRPDLPREQLERTRRLMDSNIRDCLVEGYEGLIDTLLLPDPADRHVLAAAIVSKARFIITFNRKDFPATALSPHGIEAQHPDRFITKLIGFAPDDVCIAMKRHRQSLKHPPKSVDEYLALLARQGLSETVNHLQGFIDLL